jgi:hypothetical protein
MDALDTWEKTMKTPRETITTIDLGYEQMWIFDGGRDARVRVLYGASWLTGEAAPEDRVLPAGAELALARGRTLVQALAPTRLQLTARRAGLRDALATAGWRWRSRAARWIGRTQFGPAAAGPCA